ncbi:hypothetical protein QN402_31905, partial [Pseudomonas sp. FG1]|nr:hypothetical protein [Pseudomonas sp. FG1]
QTHGAPGTQNQFDRKFIKRLHQVFEIFLMQLPFKPQCPQKCNHHKNKKKNIITKTRKNKIINHHPNNPTQKNIIVEAGQENKQN